MSIRHISICGLPCSTLFFHIISYTAWFSGKKKKVIEHCLFWQEFCEILSQMYNGIHVKSPLFLSDFNKTSIFSTDFRKICKYQISWKSTQQNPIFSMRTDRRSDMTKIVAFRNYANAPKNCWCPFCPGAFSSDVGGVFQLQLRGFSFQEPYPLKTYYIHVFIYGGYFPKLFSYICPLAWGWRSG